MATQRAAKQAKPKKIYALSPAEVAQEYVKRPAACYELQWAATYRRALVDALAWPTGTIDLEHNARGEEIKRETLRVLADKLCYRDLTAVVKLAIVLARVKPDDQFEAYVKANSEMWRRAAETHFRKLRSEQAKRGWKTRKQHARAAAAH